MAGENEPAKLLLPYLQRADELQKHEPLVAYYCRLYAMERGLKIPQSERTKTTNSLLVSLMKQLEKDKKSLQLGPDDHLHLEGFAMNVFSKADKQDRAGKADLNTAKTFYAASIFFEIINQFGELQPDLEQKQKYAAWKAADIRKALKEGRKPVPGPPGGEKDLSVPPSTSSGEYDLESRSTDPALQDVEQRRTDVPFQDIELRSDTAIRPPTGADYPPQPGSDAATRPTFESDSSPQTYDTVNFHHSANIPPPSNLVASPSSNLPPSPYPADDYPTHTFHQPPSTNGSENYSQFYHQQAYRHEAQQHYPSHDVPSYSYPHFQSYPSFTESSLPTAPSHYPSQYQGSDASYSTTSAPSTTNYASGTQYNSPGGNGSVSEAKITAAQTYHYDSSYQPPPEKIAEAHKAARFAVGALAFDEVSVAVDFLKKSLELLTLPSAGH
nr:protein HOMOLOG OF MAMMALIAN LYST-INTERACTING PROTEIN 5-like [Coffea arabica]